MQHLLRPPRSAFMRGSSHLLKLGLAPRLCLGIVVVAVLWLLLFSVMR